jgi:signal transduction histidine kinase
MQELFFTVDLSWQVDEGCEPASPEERQHWFLIVQGAISNAIRHSGAKHIDLTMGVEGDANLVLRIEDDGRGFDSAEKEIKPRSGLVNMQWRARQLGAELEMQTAPGQGVFLQVTKRPGGVV